MDQNIRKESHDALRKSSATKTPCKQPSQPSRAWSRLLPLTQPGKLSRTR